MQRSKKITSLRSNIGKIEKNLELLVENLLKKGLSPELNSIPLIKVIKEKSTHLVNFIRDNSILSRIEDMEGILSMGLSSKENERNVYNAIFKKNFFPPNLKITSFSGGTGSKSLIGGITELKGELNILVNAYDDGKSTGDIREKLNILGPSDISKNIIHLINDNEKSLKSFLEYRLPKEGTSEDIRAILNQVFEGNGEGEVGILFNKLGIQKKEAIKKYISTFLKKISKWEEKNGMEYDLKDYGIRNIIYTGALIGQDYDYHKTNKELLLLFGCQGNIFLNSYEDVWLVGLTEKGNYLRRESEIVSNFLDEEIKKGFLLKKMLSKREEASLKKLSSLEEKENFLLQKALLPSGCDDALRAIRSSEILIFPPTTLYSSLIPTLMTKGISKEIIGSNALKISIANLVRERGRLDASEINGIIEDYINYENRSNKKQKLDYIIVNNHGLRTDGVFEANRIPIDKKGLMRQGTEIIEVDIGGPSGGRAHNKELLAKIINSLYLLKKEGYRLSRGKLTKEANLDKKATLKKRLKLLLDNPPLFSKRRGKIEELLCEILNVNSLEEFKPKKQTRVLINAGGKATRLKSEYPKVLYPIGGKANLEILLEKYKLLDKKPLVITNKNDVASLNQWAKEKKRDFEVYVDEREEGVGQGVYYALKEVLGDFEGNILVSWGDITNIKAETIFLISAIHEALEDSSIVLPTSWEKNPYAGLVRDSKGEVTGSFFPNKRDKLTQKIGEHDASIFLCNKKEIQESLKDLMEIKTGENINFLETINYLCSNKKEVIGVCCATNQETQGFNTPEEAKKVEEYYLKENDNLVKEKSIRKLKKDFFKDIKISNKPKKGNIKNNELILKRYLEKEYLGLLLDFDETLTEKNQSEIPKEILEYLVDIINKDVPIGIVTGRTNRSFTKKFIEPLEKHKKISLERLKKNLFIYLEGGTYGYQYGAQKKDLEYSKKIPLYILEAARDLLRDYILHFEDDYSLRPHKIHIWPKEPKNQEIYLLKINELFRQFDIPLKAWKSNSVKSSGSIIILLDGAGKKDALDHFIAKTSLNLDNIAKIGDMADSPSSVDYPLLQGEGSFCVAEGDTNSKSQIILPYLKGKDYEGVNGTKWLLEKLNFKKRKHF